MIGIAPPERTRTQEGGAHVMDMDMDPKEDLALRTVSGAHAPAGRAVALLVAHRARPRSGPRPDEGHGPTLVRQTSASG
jgi:hypothetical protein